MATQLQEAEPVESGETVEERDYEAEARVQGWSPRDEFPGDPEKWVTAKEFVERGETRAGLLKQANNKLKDRVVFLERQVKKLAKAEQAAYESALSRLKAEQKEAVEYGDVAAFEKIDKQIETMRKEVSDEAPGEDPKIAFAEFRDANEWYDLGGLPGATDAERRARALADRIADRMSAQGLQKELTPSQFFERVAEQVREQIPMLGADAKPVRQKPGVDVAGVTRPGAGRTARTGANLPADAKAQALRFFERGIIKAKDKAEALDKYAKTYQWD